MPSTPAPIANASTGAAGYAVAVAPPLRVTPPENSGLPVPLPPKAQLPVPFAPRSSVRDYVVHGALTLVTVGGIGALAYVEAGATLAAAALAAAVATGFGMARAFGAGKRPDQQLLAALEAQNQSLATTQELLTGQQASLAADREDLQTDRQRLSEESARLESLRQDLLATRSRDQIAMGDTLARERATFNDQVEAEVERRIAPMREDLRMAREGLLADIRSFDQRKSTTLAPLAAEFAKLSPKMVKAIVSAVEKYQASEGSRAQYGFAVDTYLAPYHKTFTQQHRLKPDRVLVALLNHGKLVAGPIHRHDGLELIEAGGATTLTSIDELVAFLRAATARKLAE